MRVAIVAECFTPTWNGVTNSVLRTIEHLERRGHDALVIAPGPGPVREGDTPVHRLPAVTSPLYRSLPIGLPYCLEQVLAHFAPDVVHLAAPVLLGEAAGRICARSGIPLRGLRGVRTVVVGDGPLRPRLERELPDVRFVGYRRGAELARTVASLDVFVHTGPHETYCQAAQEALACGVPVVAPASGGLLDLVAHGRNGWLYPADRPHLLRQAVGALAEDAALVGAMGVEALASVAGRTWSDIGDQLIGHYRSVLAPDLRVRPLAA